MTLQKLSITDTKHVAQLLTDYWKERGLSQYSKQWAQEYLREGHKKEIQADEFFVYKDSDIVGVVSLITDVSGVAEIRDLVVDPKYREKDYAKKVLNEIIKVAKERKIRKLFALVLIQHERLFSSLGFEKEGLLKHHFAKDETVVVMSLFL